jgi:hypothetical protein
MNDHLNELKNEYELKILEWQTSHLERILKELKEAGIELTRENIDIIIHETDYKTRSKKHPDSCPCYNSSGSCHIDIESLNCFLCACPNYSLPMPGFCKIDSPFKKNFIDNNIPGGFVLDCSDCIIPHFQGYLRTYLEKNIDSLKKLSESL